MTQAHHRTHTDLATRLTRTHIHVPTMPGGTQQPIFEYAEAFTTPPLHTATRTINIP